MHALRQSGKRNRTPLEAFGNGKGSPCDWEAIWQRVATPPKGERWRFPTDARANFARHVATSGKRERTDGDSAGESSRIAQAIQRMRPLAPPRAWSVLKKAGKPPRFSAAPWLGSRPHRNLEDSGGGGSQDQTSLTRLFSILGKSIGNIRSFSRRTAIEPDFSPVRHG